MKKRIFLVCLIFLSTLNMCYAHDINNDINYQIIACENSVYQNILQRNSLKNELQYIEENKYNINNYINVLREKEYDLAVVEIRIQLIDQYCHELRQTKIKENIQ